MTLAGVGLYNAVCVGVGLAGGWLVDRALGTLPLCTLVGLAVGIILGCLGTYREVRRYLRN